MVEKVKALRVGVLPVILFFYILLGIVSRNYVFDISRNIFFIALITFIIFQQYGEHSSIIEKKGTQAHFFLYFGVFLLMVQNIVLLLFHGITTLDYDIDAQLPVLDKLDSSFRVYRAAYYLDLIGYCFLFGYFRLVKASENKTLYKYIGQGGVVSFLGISLIWRIITSFYTLSTISEWYSDYTTTTMKTLMFLAQLGLILVWYSIWKLYEVAEASSSHSFLDNKQNIRTDIPKYAKISTIIIAVTFIFFTLFITNNDPSEFGFGLRVFFILKTLAIPLVSFVTQLSIYRRYNFLF